MIGEFKHIWARFRADEQGAVTVDWVVLVAAVIGLSMVVLGIIWQGAFGFTLRLNADVESIDVANYTAPEQG